MIDWHVNDIQGLGFERADVLTMVFLGTALGKLQSLHHVYIREVLGDTRISFSVDQNYML